MATRACVKLLRSGAGVKISLVSRPLLCLNSCVGRKNVLQVVPMYTANSLCTSTITRCQSLPETATDSDFIARIRGMNFRTRKHELQKFLDENGINVVDIEFLFNVNQKFTGIAFVRVAKEEDLQNVLKLNKQYLADRYLEINKASAELYNKFGDPDQTRIVKLTNLPYSVTRDEIREFFNDLDIVTNGIRLPLGRDLSSTGIGFVLFSSPEDATEAIKRTGQLVGNREVNIYKWTVLSKGGRSSQRRDDFRPQNYRERIEDQQQTSEESSETTKSETMTTSPEEKKDNIAS